MSEHDDWDDHWDRFAGAASDNPAQQMRHAIVAHLLIKNGPTSPSLLDLGSGQGDLIAKLTAESPEASFVGFELSESGVRISQSKVPSAKFVVADLFAPPEAVSPFKNWANVAVCSEVLEHVDDPVAFLAAARPFLSDGCLLIVTVPGGPMSAFDRHIGHRQHFNRKSIGAILEKAGFSTQKIYLSGFPFFNLYRTAVIARGAKLVHDVDAKQPSIVTPIAKGAMAIFRALFRLNLLNTPLGWQVVAVARKRS